ncbi:hypothetical protein WMY93_017536 [Mugilogobius chulae]|uniref:Reverse transcriptase domain-containing protein n=1 Tax=Mugilogobius chulae TaxID=88201 RepID=A0AAW0NV11_9GOBI
MLAGSGTLLVAMIHPPPATKASKRTIPSESARARAEDDSLTDLTATDNGMETTQRNVTTVKGLKIHQGRKKCLKEPSEGPRIDQYFLRSGESKSIEIQWQDKHHSPQDIKTPPRASPGTYAPSVPTPEPIQPKPAVERNIEGSKPQILWPQSCQKGEWEVIDKDLSSLLQNLKGDVERRLEKMGEIVYTYGKERFGVRNKKPKSNEGQCPCRKSRRQVEIDKLVKERRQLRKQWKKANNEERVGLGALQKKSGVLKIPVKDIEEYLKDTYSEGLTLPDQSGLGLLPEGMPPLHPIVHEMDTGPPTWKEIVNTVKRARSASAPGPNGIPYRLYKNAPGVLKYLWHQMKLAWKKVVIPKVWRRAGGIFIPKEKNSSTINQFRQISLLNVEGKMFFSIVAQRLSAFLMKNNLIDTSVQKAGISGFSGCLEHASIIWNQLQAAKKNKKNLHVVFLDLANAFGSVPHRILWAAFAFFQVPETITKLVQAYFRDIQFCITTCSGTTAWQHLELGIMAGCTISPLAFTMAMELIIRASSWVVGGERLEVACVCPPSGHIWMI